MSGLYALTEGTKNGLLGLLGEVPADGPPDGGRPNRQVIHVKVTGAKAGDYHPGNPVHVVNGTEVTYGACKVRPLGTVPLRTNAHYLALRTADVDGLPAYVVAGPVTPNRGKQCDDCTFVFWVDGDTEPECPS